MENKAISSLKTGQSAKILGFSVGLDLKTKRRLLELGFVKDTFVTLEKKSMLSKVFLLSLNGYLLCVRKHIAKKVFVYWTRLCL